MSTLEIILPVRNPTAVFKKTVQSLVAQSDRGFSVLISDNFSTNGGEFITAAATELQKAGITVRVVRPPCELGRVEHWNWAHCESSADWLKPLFAGDYLEPDYIAKLRAGASAHPDCRYIFCNYQLHLGGNPPTPVCSAWSGRFLTATEMQPVVLRYGMQFGPPSAAAFERTAFIAVGCYPAKLPVCADSLLFCTLAARFGVLGLAETLCHFNIHDARFSTNLAQRRTDTFRETITYFWMLANYARAEKIPFSKIGFARLLLRQIRAHRSAR